MEGIAKESSGADPNLQLYMSFGYVPKFELLIGTVFVASGKAIANPAAFKEIEAMKPVPFTSTTRITNISSLAKEISTWNIYGKGYAPPSFLLPSPYLLPLFEKRCVVSKPLTKPTYHPDSYGKPQHSASPSPSSQKSSIYSSRSRKKSRMCPACFPTMSCSLFRKSPWQAT